MKRKKQWMLFVIILAANISCTKVIKVNVPNGATLIVVNAFLDNSSKPQTVRLTFNANYFSNVATPPVLGAIVSLNDLTNARVYNFVSDGNGNYIYTPGPNDSMARIHHQYQLNISYNNNYTALSVLNRSIEVARIEFRISATDVGGTYPLSDTTSPRKFFPYVYVKDSAGPLSDFYWMKVFKNGVFYDQPAQLNVIQNDGYPGNDGDTIIANFSFRNLTLKDNPLYRNDICEVEIYSIDNNTYDFLTQLKGQLTNAESGLFALTPQNIKTNIRQVSGTQQAIGWFNIGAITSNSCVAR